MVKVSYLGPAGTFTEAALLQLAANHPDIIAPADELEAVPASSPMEALAMVRQGEVCFACIAIENSVDGPVTAAFDALCTGPELQIFAETELDVVFSILVREGTELADIQTLSAHPVGLQQVRDWAENNVPDARLIPASSNAAAAVDVAEGRIDAAAAPARAGELLGLATLAAGIADVRGARTRFVLVGQPAVPTAPTGRDRTSVAFTLPNEPGTLVTAMTEFSIRDIDLTRIESRPTRQALGVYRFYIDCSGHIADPIVAEALQALYRRVQDLRFLGSWPAESRAKLQDACPPDISEAQDWVASRMNGKRG
ncbi:prephenate dehydratase [Corynebacterium ulceribovis]|uniref:prephenate dehydratase n=1 Tax=Corynebacterium ulceribovis TaxID=487732 RepID=UPI000366BB65|nr:prephenate dehydratase [Corynebacterium ulceribovis]